MEFIENIINFFKKLFIKEKIKNIETIIEQEKQEQIEEIKENLEGKNDDFLSDIQEFDIIWAKRYNNETQKCLIPEGHRKGPYIVVDRCDEGLICSKGTSVDQSEYLGLYLKLESLKYKLFKDTYFKCADFEIINNSSFIGKIDVLKKPDIEKFLKLIKKIGKDYFCNNKYQYEKLILPFQVGDIINNINNFLIIDIKDNKLFCIRIKKSTDYLKNNFEYKDHIYLDYSNIIVFDINHELECINTIDDKLLNYILKKQKEYLENQKNQTIAQRGSVIKKENQYYFVYGEEGQEWLVFEIFRTRNAHNEKIIINNKTFYTNYVALKINKKDDFEICLAASADEIDLIKLQRKNYNKQLKNNTKKDFEVGNIIESICLQNKTFIIIDICIKTYKCLTIKKLKKAVYQTVYIKKEEAFLSENVSLKGIKWLDCNPQFDLSKIGNQKYLDKIFETQKKYLLEKKEIQNTYSNEVGNTEIISELGQKTQRGSVILKDERHYYIYGEEGSDWLIFEILKDNIKELNLDKIIISSQIFYTNYNTIKINKKEAFKFIVLATQDEIDEIKKSKKSYSKSEKEKNKTITSKKIKPIEINGEKYIIKERIGNLIGCVSIYDLSKANQKKKYFDINEAMPNIEEKNKQKKLEK